MKNTSDQQASSHAPTPARGKHRLRRRLLILAVVLVALIILFRLVLDPIAAWATRRTLNNLDGIKGTFSSVHVGVIPPSYEINRFKLVVSERKDWNKPWVYIEHM